MIGPRARLAFAHHQAAPRSLQQPAAVRQVETVEAEKARIKVGEPARVVAVEAQMIQGRGPDRRLCRHRLPPFLAIGRREGEYGAGFADGPGA